MTGGGSGIGRAVAIAFARDGADVLTSYLNEEDAAEARRLVEEAGRQCLLVPGDISKADHCRSLVQQAVDAFGRMDVLVINAAHQMSFEAIEDISDAEWDLTFATNISAMFYITKAAVPHMKNGSANINTASVNAYTPERQGRTEEVGRLFLFPCSGLKWHIQRELGYGNLPFSVSG